MSAEVRVGEALESSVPYVHRFAVTRPQGGDLEGRFLATGGPPGDLDLFSKELAALSVLDHPLYPPVLSYGVIRGQFGYLVPHERAPRLLDLLRRRVLAKPLRVRIAIQLARGLATAHRRGLAWGGVRFEGLHWDEAALTLRLPFPLGYLRAASPDRFARPPDPAAPPETRDVVAWGSIALAVLAGTPDALADPRAAAAGLGGPGSLAGALAGLARGARGGDETERPANALELTHLIDQMRKEIVVTRSYGALPLTGPRAARDQLAATRSEVVAPEIRAAVDGPLPAVREIVAAAAATWTPDPADARARLGAFARGPGLAAVGALAAAALFGRAAAGLWGGVDRAAADLRPPAGSRPATSPELRALTASPVVPPAEFPRVWQRLRALKVAGHLRGRGVGAGDLRALRARFGGDPDGACDAMEGLLRRLGDGGGPSGTLR